MITDHKTYTVVCDKCSFGSSITIGIVNSNKSNSVKKAKAFFKKNGWVINNCSDDLFSGVCPEHKESK